MTGAARSPATRSAFTLLEMLLSVTLLATAFAIAYGTFAAATRAWQRGTQVADAVGAGDLVMERLVSALRSAVYFPAEYPRYAFLHEQTRQEPPAARVSWVTAAAGFLPPDAPLAGAAYRIEIEFDPEGETGPELIQRAWRHLVEEPEDAQIDRRVISRNVRGFRVRMRAPEEEEPLDAWREDWDEREPLPRSVELTLLISEADSRGDDLVLQRRVEIPIAPLSEGSGGP